MSKTLNNLMKKNKFIEYYQIDGDGVWVSFKLGYMCACCECRCGVESGTCHTDTITEAVKCINNGWECSCNGSEHPSDWD